MKMNVLIRIQILLLASVFAFACSDEVWNSHYDTRPEFASNTNLWATIESAPELSSFAKVLKAHGYDRLLSQSQAYTVFAPNNQAMASLDTTKMNVEKEFLRNHIARFIHAASGTTDVAVGTLNGKRIKLSFKNGGYYFGNAAFGASSKSIVSTNGIVHIIGERESFFPNLWEYMGMTEGLDSIKKYFYSYDKMLFNAYASVPGSVVDGKQTYIDSVFVNYNPLLSQYGYINLEDSSYTILMPTNAAWNAAYDKIKPYFESHIANKYRADSLQRANTTTALIQDLIYNNRLQASPADSMISTSLNVFYKPQYLFTGALPFVASNGTAYVANELRIDALDSWHKPIKVEAEYIVGRTVTPLATPFTERAPVGISSISNGRYLRVAPSSPTVKPWVIFEIPNTLASYYDIFVVLISPKLVKPKDTPKPCKVNFALTYITTNGKENSPEDVFPSANEVYITHPDVVMIDTVKVVSDFKFPSANFGEKLNTVKLKVSSKVSTTETALYSNELLIDCILLKPKKK